MVTWGGNNGSTEFKTGGCYDPLADSWITVATNNAPTARYAQTAVWSGTQMIIWGGTPSGSSGLGDGGLYNPTNNIWTMMAYSAPDPRNSQASVWTGSELLIWGGYNGGALSNGASYNLATDTWTPMSTWTNASSNNALATNAPSARYGHTAVWTGTEMIIWGGGNYSVNFNDTAAYTLPQIMYLYEKQ